MTIGAATARLTGRDGNAQRKIRRARVALLTPPHALKNVQPQMRADRIEMQQAGWRLPKHLESERLRYKTRIGSRRIRSRRNRRLGRVAAITDRLQRSAWRVRPLRMTGLRMTSIRRMNRLRVIHCRHGSTASPLGRSWGDAFGPHPVAAPRRGQDQQQAGEESERREWEWIHGYFLLSRQAAEGSPRN